MHNDSVFFKLKMHGIEPPQLIGAKKSFFGWFVGGQGGQIDPPKCSKMLQNLNSYPTGPMTDDARGANHGSKSGQIFSYLDLSNIKYSKLLFD